MSIISNPHILAIDDNTDDQRMYARTLRGSYTVRTALSAKEGLLALAETTPALILLDYNLPDMNGLEILALLTKRTNAPSAPVVMLTGEGNETVAVAAMKNGASDYLVKDILGRHLRLLPSVIERTLTTHAHRTEAVRLQRLHNTILRTVADGILGVDIEGRIVFSNPAAERMLLIPSDESSANGSLIDRPLSDFLCRNGVHIVWSDHPLTTVCIKAATIHCEEDSLRRSNGALFPISYTASPGRFDDSATPGLILVFQNITERKKAEAELIQSARYDPLTGLPNRAMFKDFLTKALSRAHRNEHPLAILFIDLDGFKAVNDHFGHHAGDQLLQMVAQRLADNVRTYDLVSRLGGDEFTLVMENGRPDQVIVLAKKIVDTIAHPFIIINQPVHISASVGISIFPCCAMNAYDLLGMADRAMYSAKEAGKNAFRFFCHIEGGARTSCRKFITHPASIKR
ncbi:two-component system, cell cycle response regulator [Gammaproteobacteria bacterium]